MWTNLPVLWQLAAALVGAVVVGLTVITTIDLVALGREAWRAQRKER